MTEFAPVHGFLGGAMIGLAAVLLMAGIGRVAGVSGITLGAIVGGDADGRGWRLAFIAGLPLGALLVGLLGLKDWSLIAYPAGPLTMLAGGLAVGFGATVGAGCTSGHGICGLARLAPRSLAATLTFMAVAAATVFVMRHLIGTGG